MLQDLLFGVPAQSPPLLIIIIVLWSIFWKALALWRAVENNQKIWFLIILLLNTLGILEIIYLKFFQMVKRKAKD